MLLDASSRKVLVTITLKFFQVFRTLDNDDFFIFAKTRASEQAQNLYRQKKLVVFIPEDDRVLGSGILKKIFAIKLSDDELNCIQLASLEDFCDTARTLADNHQLRLTHDLHWTIQPLKLKRRRA